MKGALAIRNPISGMQSALDTSSTNVTSSAYVTLLTKANSSNPCSAIQFHNSGAQPLKVATGDAGSEVDTGVVIPLGVSILIPIEVKKSTRLSLKSMGGTQSSGIVTASFFQ